LDFSTGCTPDIQTVPGRPAESGIALYGKTNNAIVEFVPINTKRRDEDIPTQLSNALESAYTNRPDRKALGQAAFTVFGELIDNIFEHSQSLLDGYAALQVYNSKKGRSALVAVSDSGQGILESLRPSLIGTSLAALSDPELIVHMLNEGISRHGDERGCGLKQSAEHALKYKAELTIRLPTASLHLVPSPGGYDIPDRAYGRTDLPRILGTHLAFRFLLDKS
jgi:hypothetical protein